MRDTSPRPGYTETHLHEVCAGVTPVCLILGTHLYGLLSQLTTVGVLETTQYKHNTRLHGGRGEDRKRGREKGGEQRETWKKGEKSGREKGVKARKGEERERERTESDGGGEEEREREREREDLNVWDAVYACDNDTSHTTITRLQIVGV